MCEISSTELSEIEEAEERSYFEQREHIFKNVDIQVRELFQHVVDMGGLNPYPKPVYRKSEQSKVAADQELSDWLDKKMIDKVRNKMT